MIVKKLENEELIEYIANLEAECFSTPWSVESIRDTWEKDYNIIYVAVDEENKDSFAGYLIANVIGDESELLRVAVSPNLRGRKIGDMLLTYYLDDVPNMRYLLEVRENNVAAKSLYLKHGYKEIAVRKNYYKDPIENGCIFERNI